MLRSIAAVALVAVASSQVQNNPTNLADIQDAIRICNTKKNINQEEISCEDVIEFGHCLVLAGVDFQAEEGDGAMYDFKVQAEYDMEDWQAMVHESCRSHKDTLFPEETLESKSTIFSFEHEIVSIFDVAERTAALDARVKLAADATAAVEQQYAIMANYIKNENTTFIRDTELKAGEQGASTVDVIRGNARKTFNGVNTEIGDTTAEVDEALVELNGVLNEKADEVSTSITDKLTALEEEVEGELSSYTELASWPNNTANTKWERNYEFVMAEKAPANTENGHAGRWMYKVDFNPNNPGYWYPGGEELKSACRELSEDLKSLDGIDRDLKPAADVDWASDDDSVRLQGSYLSHCGCGNHPRQRHCVGMSRLFLAGAAMYNRYHSWNGCHYLRHDSRDCHHHWADCHGRSDVQAKYTICTSANDNFKEGPKGCGKTRCGLGADYE